MFHPAAFLTIILSALSAGGLLSHPPSAAHGGHSHETDNLAAEVFAKTFQLAPEIVSPPNYFGQKTAVSYPYIKVRGRRLYFNRVPPSPFADEDTGAPVAQEAAVNLNSQFWTLVEYWLRLYHNELSSYCPCEWDPKELAAEARETVYQGFFSAKIGQPVADKLVSGAETVYDLGARYGKAAMALQVAAEIAETILFKGNHLLCKLNNVFALALVRPIQLFFRLTGHSANALDESRLLMTARWGWTARAVRRAQRKVRFHLMSAALDEEAIPSVNEEGPKNRREKWLRKVSSKTAPLIERRQELDEQIAGLKIAAAASSEGAGRKERRAARKAFSALQKAAEKRDRLNDKIGSLTELPCKTYLGRRIGLSLWIFSRKGRARCLQGETKADRAASAGSWFYALAANENIIERAFLHKSGAFFEGVHESSSSEGGPNFSGPEFVGGAADNLLPDSSLGKFHSFFERTDESPDKSEADGGAPHPQSLSGAGDGNDLLPDGGFSGNEAAIQKGLAREFAAELKKDGLTLDEEGAALVAEGLLGDIAGIFDPSRPLFERYALQSVMEAALAGFFPHYTDIVYRRIQRLHLQAEEPLSLSERQRRFRLRLNIRSALSGFTYHAYQYFDFLRAAAVAKNETALESLKYESMESLLRFLRYLAELAPLTAEGLGGGAALSGEDLLHRLRANGAKIIALQPWRERRTAFGLADLFVPFVNPPLPRCRDLILKRAAYY